jgi:hypothetical protein
MTGLTHPHGLTSAHGSLFIVDVGTRSLVQVPLAGGDHEVIAVELPVGVNGGGLRKTLNGLRKSSPAPSPSSRGSLRP